MICSWKEVCKHSRNEAIKEKSTPPVKRKSILKWEWAPTYTKYNNLYISPWHVVMFSKYCSPVWSDWKTPLYMRGHAKGKKPFVSYLWKISKRATFIFLCAQRNQFYQNTTRIQLLRGKTHRHTWAEMYHRSCYLKRNLKLNSLLYLTTDF